MGACYKLPLATPHRRSLQPPAGYPTWVLTVNSRWLPRMGARSKLPLATPHGCLLQILIVQTHMGVHFKLQGQHQLITDGMAK